MSTVTEKDLLMALLSLDSYHQGYERGIRHNKTQIGNATKTGESETVETSEEYKDGFYAVTYDTEFGEILSIRGTDFFTGEKARDILRGWVIGGGDITSANIGHAANFLEQTQPGDAKGSVILTGHSLGGGLAGLMSYLFGNEAIIFDPMPYLLAADNIKKAFEDTPEQIEIERQIDLAVGVGDLAVINARFDARLEKHQIAVDIYKRSLTSIPDEDFDANILTSFVDNADGWFAPGEALDSLLGFIGRDDADYPWVQALGLTGKSANLDAGSVVDLHGPGLKVLQTYSDLHGFSEEWLPIHDELYSALFTTKVAERVVQPGKVDESLFREGYGSGTLISTIAYSTIEGSTGLVFGNTGAKALFDDANELGRLVENGQLPGILTDNTDDFAELIVQFAGQMALQKVDYNDFTLPPEIDTISAVQPEQGILSFFKDGVAVANDNELFTMKMAA